MLRAAIARLWSLWQSAVPRWRGVRVSRVSLGGQGEKLACRYLRRRRYRIVARGQRTRWGEIDIIAVDGRTVVFVEVKTRRRSPDRQFADVVDRTKQERMTRGALAYLKQHRLLGYPCRFDVITILWPPGSDPEIRHYRHAFEAVTDQWSLF
jgi:putative endonuclease